MTGRTMDYLFSSLEISNGTLMQEIKLVKKKRTVFDSWVESVSKSLFGFFALTKFLRSDQSKYFSIKSTSTDAKFLTGIWTKDAKPVDSEKIDFGSTIIQN